MDLINSTVACWKKYSKCRIRLNCPDNFSDLLAQSIELVMNERLDATVCLGDFNDRCRLWLVIRRGGVDYNIYPMRATHIRRGQRPGGIWVALIGCKVQNGTTESVYGITLHWNRGLWLARFFNHRIRAGKHEGSEFGLTAFNSLNDSNLLGQSMSLDHSIFIFFHHPPPRKTSEFQPDFFI